MRVFADSGGWYSVLVRDDHFREIGKSYYDSLLRKRTPVLTTDFILDEVVTRLRYDVGHAKAMEFMSLARAAESLGSLTIHAVSRADRDRATEIFQQYPDTVLSFTDCASFAFLESNSCDEVFGYDGHFEMLGHILRPDSNRR